MKTGFLSKAKDAVTLAVFHCAINYTPATLPGQRNDNTSNKARIIEVFIRKEAEKLMYQKQVKSRVMVHPMERSGMGLCNKYSSYPTGKIPFSTSIAYYHETGKVTVLSRQCHLPMIYAADTSPL